MYQLVVKGNEDISEICHQKLGDMVAIREVRQLPGWQQSFVLVDTDLHESTMRDKLNRWMNEIPRTPPFPNGSLLWWTRPDGYYTEYFGPVTVITPDGTTTGDLMPDDSIRLHDRPKRRGDDIPPVSDYSHWNEDAEAVWYLENKYDMEHADEIIDDEEPRFYDEDD